jgi:hypothetical protein
MLCFAVGCGSGSHKESANNATIAQGSVTAGCSGAMVGAGSNDWRPLATAVGRFGVYGSGRDFRTAQKTPVSLFRGLQRRQVSGPILVTKTPLVVEGKDPVEVSIVPDNRARAGLVVPPFGFRGGPTERSASSPAAISRGPGGQRGGRSGIPIQSQSWSTKPTGLNHNWSSGGPSSPRQDRRFPCKAAVSVPPAHASDRGPQPG